MADETTTTTTTAGGDAHICVTEKAESFNKLVLNVEAGRRKFVKLWAQGVTLRWRYAAGSVTTGAVSPAAFESAFKTAYSKWINGPVKIEGPVTGDYDFEVKLDEKDYPVFNDDGSLRGYVLASAFFPSSPQDERVFHVYPRSVSSLVSTLEHEIGHVFGLRHYFGLSEGGVAYFRHDSLNPQSIMNYGANSVLTAKDISDLRDLYQQVWSRTLTYVKDVETRVKVPIQLTNWNMLAGALATPAPASGLAVAGRSCQVGHDHDSVLIKLGKVLQELSGEYSKEQILQLVSNNL